MKKLLLLVLLFISVVANAQKGISYQAVILDPTKIELPGSDISGQPLVNGNVSVKFVILSGTTSQFEEVQQTKTDAYGLVNLTIGSVASSTFNAMTWDANQKSLQVFVSFNNGASYTKVSDQKLTYSPYALFAETAGKLGSILGIAGGGTGATTVVGARANLGLGNVDNTADLAKPISTATQAALDLKANAADVNSALALKATVAALQAHMAITADTSMLATKAALTDLNNYAPKASPTFTGTVSGITKSMVDLSSVDNTSDVAKPISSATQSALNLKANNTDVNSALALKANTTDVNAKAPLASPNFTGLPAAPTAAGGTNSTQIATTAFVQSSILSNTLSLGSANTSPNANGATLASNVLKLSPADATNAGFVSPTDQIFAGVKTFKDGAAKQIVAANSTLDQSNTTAFNQAGGTNQWQSFTAGATGMLSSVEWKMGTPTLPYGTAAAIVLKIYEGEGINGALLATVNGSTPANGSNIYISFPLTNVNVIAGSKYTMLLTTPAVNVSWLDVNVSNSYSGGKGSNDPNWDYLFKTNVKAITAENYITATHSGAITASSFVKTGGTSSQYLMADGSVSTGSGSSSSSSSSSSFVDLTTNQTIAGVKTFSSDLSVSGKLGLGTAAPNAESSLDIATALPIILPKMNQTQVSAIANPSSSMLQFNTSSKKMQVYKESIASTSSLFGNTTLSTGATCLRGSGELWFKPTISGTITQIELSAFGAGEVASLVINSNYAGASPASTLLGSSNSITAVDGWNTWTFATPVPVVANTTYFITSTDANRCLGVRWSNSGDDATTGNVSSMGYGNPLNSYDPASRITVVVPATNGWVNLRDDVATTNLSTEVTNILPLTNGGTGSSTKNFVDLSSSQTVAGAKSFSGNVVVGASAATGTSAALEVKSTTQGLLLPRLTTTQRDAVNTPLAGLLIYNSTAGKIQAYTEAEGTAATLSNVASSYAGLGLSYDYNICLSFTPTANWRVSSFSLGVQSVATAGNITLSLYSGVPGSGILLGSQTVATSALSAGLLNFNFSTPITVPPGSCYWKATADNTALIFLPRLNQFNDGVNESFTALRNNNTVVVNLPSYSFSFSMPYTPLIGSWTDLH